MSQYAEKSDLVRLGIPASALQGIPDPDIDASLAGASGLADEAIRARLPATAFPLVSWGDGLRRRVSMLAAYDLLSVRGFNPQAGADLNMKWRYDDARKDLALYAEGKLHLDITPRPDQVVDGNQPLVISGPMRGF